MRTALRLFPLLGLCMLSGGAPQPSTIVIPAVFRWRSGSGIEWQERQAIQRYDIQRVYNKLYDIDWNPANGAHPIARSYTPYEWRGWYDERKGPWSGSVDFVPCIYITNATFARISDEETDELARNLLRGLRQHCPADLAGVMLDCDWTASTRRRFFRLTQLMNDSLAVPVTATIRLHQYAAPKKTGVPPADRGMLMPYNVGRVNEPGDGNSIFNRAEAEPYFARSAPYPLPLDIALPAFGWGAHFRNGRFMGLVHETDLDDAIERGVLTGARNGTMQVTYEDSNHHPALHLGDHVRIERITESTLADVVRLCLKAVNSDTTAIAFFESGTRAFQAYDSTVVLSSFEAFGPRRIFPSRPWQRAGDESTPADTAASEGSPLDSAMAVPVNIPEIKP